MDIYAVGLTIYCKTAGLHIVTASPLPLPLKLIIATPGRLLEILKQGAVQLGGVRMVVIDEVSCFQVLCVFSAP